MNNVIEVSDKEQFAKGQDSRDLRVCYDAGDAETRFMDAIDSAYNFFRFLQVSTRGMANNQRRPFKDGHQHPGTSGRRNRDRQRAVELLAEATPKPINYAYDPPAGVPRRSGKYIEQSVVVRNGREELSKLSLDTNGFVLTAHETAVKDFYDPDEVKSVYYPEVERLLKRVTGAERVVIFDHIVRNPLLAERSEKGRSLSGQVRAQRLYLQIRAAPRPRSSAGGS